MIFLGEASNLRGKTLKHLFAFGTKSDSNRLKSALATRYGSKEENVFLTANGRSALCLALKNLVSKGSEVVLNGLTCQAVVIAIKSAGCVPVFADIEEKDLNYSEKTLNSLLNSHKNVKAFIIQNSLGNPVDIRPFEKLAKEKNLVLIEDLAHCTGRKYPDGREIGTVGDVAALSFGKGKSIDTITGGALILKNPVKPLKFQSSRQSLSRTLRARWYPFFGALLRACYKIHLNKPLVALLLKLHWIERSADAPLDLNSRLSHWQAKLALEQLNSLEKNPGPLREFELVENREELLKKLRKNGYIFDEIWYDVPVSPARYYKKSGFDEKSCPKTTEIAKKIINLPTWYKKEDLKTAKKIIKEHEK